MSIYGFVTICIFLFYYMSKIIFDNNVKRFVMSNQIRIEFVLACLLTKYYLTSQDPDVKFGETKFDDEGFALDY